MYTFPKKQCLYKDESIRKDSIANMCSDTSMYRSLRKESAMATLKKRRASWYARVLWYDNHGRKKEKQVPLRTKS